ncbi:MAG: DsbA family protein [Pseudomonadota bacterium]
MTLTADVYFSYRSPYSYLATPRYLQLTRDWDLTISLKTVYPIAIRDPGFFEREHPSWISYLQRDILRVAQFNDMPLVPPSPDPIVQNMKTREIAADQPYIRAISFLGVEAERCGAGLAFAAEVTAMIWGGVKDWHLDGPMGEAADRCGLDLSDMQSAIGDGADHEAEIIANQDALEAAGHWGVPTLVYEGEPFFGQDRIELALWRMKQNGLQQR